MTDKEKKDFTDIVKKALSECPPTCPIGLTKETAFELISIAEISRKGRTAIVTTVITVIVGVLVTALGYGIKVMLGK